MGVIAVYCHIVKYPMDISMKYKIDCNELDAYDILRIEPILLANIFKCDDFHKLTIQFIQRCKKYIDD